MAQRKAHEVEAWLAKPDPSKRIVLIYGPDRGLVSERARRLALSSGLSLDDPFSVVRLDAAELDQSPGRLESEARTVPMFADRRLIWVGGAGAQKSLAEEVKHLIQAPAEETLILVEAGDLRKGNPLRSTVESAPDAVALPCYADDMRSIDALIDEELGRNNLHISLDARAALKACLGGDRLASRGEIDKLALYALDKGTIEIDDVGAVIGDVGAISADDVIGSVLGGRRQRFEAAFSRYVAGGSPPFVLLNAGLRQFQALQIMKHAMESGKSAAAAVASARPPVFFSRRTLIENALKNGTSGTFERTLSLLQRAILQSRRSPTLAVSVTRQALLIALLISEGR